MKPYRLLVFDWDGTLMDSSEKIVNCFVAATCDNRLAAPEPEKIVELIGLNLPECFARLFPELGSAEISRLVASYREHWMFRDTTSMRLFPGVEKGLGQLDDAGYLLCVATGKSARGLQRALDDTALGGRFVYTRCADQGRPKPHPEMLENILSFTGVSRSEAVMIGDTVFDLEMAANAGMDGWGVAYGSHSAETLQGLSCRNVALNFGEIVELLEIAR